MSSLLIRFLVFNRALGVFLRIEYYQVFVVNSIRLSDQFNND